MITREEALKGPPLAWHADARDFLDPFDQLSYTANLMESLAAIKELLVALGAALILGWDRWRRLKEREQEEQLNQMKQRLDIYLEKTLVLERSQLGIHEPERLREMLDQISQIKLQALEELTHEDLRGDRMFSIFLSQCALLASTLQAKCSSTISEVAENGSQQSPTRLNYPQ